MYAPNVGSVFLPWYRKWSRILIFFNNNIYFCFIYHITHMSAWYSGSLLWAIGKFRRPVYVCCCVCGCIQGFNQITVLTTAVQGVKSGLFKWSATWGFVVYIKIMFYIKRSAATCPRKGQPVSSFLNSQQIVVQTETKVPLWLHNPLFYSSTRSIFMRLRGKEAAS